MPVALATATRGRSALGLGKPGCTVDPEFDPHPQPQPPSLDEQPQASTATILSHPQDILWFDRIRTDRKIRFTLPVCEIIEEDELAVTERCKRLIHHGPTSTLTLSESSTPSFLRRAIGAITSMMSSG